MPFTPATWQDGSGGGTPITAAELNRMEAGINSARNIAGFENALPPNVQGQWLYAVDTFGMFYNDGADWQSMVFPYIAVTGDTVVDNAGAADVGTGGTLVGYTNTPNFRLGRAEGAEGSPAPVAADKELGRIVFRGYNGSTWVAGADISATAKVAYTGSNQSTYMAFSVRRGADFLEAMRIAASGLVGVQQTAPAALLHIGDSTGTLADHPPLGTPVENAPMGLKVETNSGSGLPAPDLIQGNLRVEPGTTAADCSGLNLQVELRDTSGGYAFGVQSRVLAYGPVGTPQNKTAVGGKFAAIAEVNSAYAVTSFGVEAEMSNYATAVNGGGALHAFTDGSVNVRFGLLIRSGLGAGTFEHGIIMPTDGGQAPATNFIYCGPAPFFNPAGGVPIFQVNLAGDTTARSMVLTGTTGTAYLELAGASTTNPASPAVGKMRIFAKDNGAGKTQTCLLYSTGQVVVLNTML